ncbi:MAG TPA: hypothetical protein QF753_09565 [Victivallales bacterium]|nr:hypothetical protein [Victivallales bacterium]
MSADNNNSINYSKKRGNKIGLWFFKVLLKYTGLSGAYSLLYFIALYYLIFDKDAVVKSSYYVKLRFPDAGLFKRYYHTYRLFFTQGQQLIDRYAYSVKSELFDIFIDGNDKIFDYIGKSGKGIIILTSHFGNWLIGLEVLKKLGNKKINILIRSEDNKAIHASFRDDMKKKINFISSENFLGGSVEVLNALEKGDIVSLTGDRHYGGKTIDVQFFNKKASFPFSAFVFAAAKKCPVLFLNTVKTGKNCYRIYINKHVWPELKGDKNDKRNQLKVYVKEFAEELERISEKYPYQCFLFNNVWKVE